MSVLGRCDNKKTSKMADGGHVCRRTGFFFSVLAQLDIEKNILTKVKKIQPVVLEEL